MNRLLIILHLERRKIHSEGELIKQIIKININTQNENLIPI